MNKKHKKNYKLKTVIISVSIIFIVLIILFITSLLQSANQYDRTKYRITIPRGASTKTVQSILEKNGILNRGNSFSFAAKVFGVAKYIQAGKYKFSPSDSVLKILLKLRNGEVAQPDLIRKMVTFPEGMSIYKMGEVLRKYKIGNPDEFQALVKEGITEDLRNRHWGIFKYIPSESLEGYLYPDTYWFFEKAEVIDLAEIMLNRFETLVIPFWEEAKKDTKYTLHEIITLASIIEKEAQKPNEREIISSVYHNRLDIGMPMSACPTIKYALNRPTKKVYYEQLEVKSPYNTYKKKGLPPGPICNPGIESIKAAVYPAKTNYYYFVAKKDGSHIFSSTGIEHNKARNLINK
jgi:peptidoglycan lytic transglycosylase G